jgi:hypothetical protein
LRQERKSAVRPEADVHFQVGDRPELTLLVEGGLTQHPLTSTVSLTTVGRSCSRSSKPDGEGMRFALAQGATLAVTLLSIVAARFLTNAGFEHAARDCFLAAAYATAVTLLVAR